MANDFLFELGCEELPSLAVKTLSTALLTHVTASLNTAQLQYESIKAFATPRRLALLITQLVEKQPTQGVSRRGPAKAAAYDKTGNPTPALLGFAKSCGVEADTLVEIETDKGVWLQRSAS